MKTMNSLLLALLLFGFYPMPLLAVGEEAVLVGRVRVEASAVSLVSVCDELRFGTGAELRLEVVLGYYIRTDVRIGVARALGALLDGGRAADREIGIPDDPAVVYLTVGSSF